MNKDGSSAQVTTLALTRNMRPYSSIADICLAKDKTSELRTLFLLRYSCSWYKLLQVSDPGALRCKAAVRLTKLPLSVAPISIFFPVSSFL